MSLDTVSASVHPDLASHQNTMKPRIHTLKGHIHMPPKADSFG